MQAENTKIEGQSLKSNASSENLSKDGGKNKDGNDYNSFLAELSEMAELPQLKSELVWTKQTRAEYSIHEEISKTLFSAIEQERKGQNNITIKGLPRTINEYDFDCFTIGVKELLYVQSLLHHNEEVNSGFKRRESHFLSKNPNITYYSGILPVSLNDLCRHAYGVEPNEGNRKALLEMLKTLKKTDVEVTFPNGDYFKGPIVVYYEYKRKSDNATFLYLILNPIYTYEIKNQFLQVPYGVMEKISLAIGKDNKRKKTRTHIKLMQLLCNQDTSKPLVRYKNEDFLDYLGLTELWRLQKTRTEKHIEQVIKDLKKAGGIFYDYKLEKTKVNGKERINKFHFYYTEEQYKAETSSPVNQIAASTSTAPTSSPTK